MVVVIMSFRKEATRCVSVRHTFLCAGQEEGGASDGLVMFSR